MEHRDGEIERVGLHTFNFWGATRSYALIIELLDFLFLGC